MKNTYTNEFSRSAALVGALNRPGIEIIRYGLVIVLLWIGGMKFTSYEAAGIAPLEMHSPLMNWLYVLSWVNGIYPISWEWSRSPWASESHYGTYFRSSPV